MKKTANRHLQFKNKETAEVMHNSLFEYIEQVTVNGQYEELRQIMEHLRHYKEVNIFREYMRRADISSALKLEILLQMVGRGREWYQDWQPLVNNEQVPGENYDKFGPIVNEILNNLK